MCYFNYLCSLCLLLLAIANWVFAFVCLFCLLPLVVLVGGGGLVKHANTTETGNIQLKKWAEKLSSLAWKMFCTRVSDARPGFDN